MNVDGIEVNATQHMTMLKIDAYCNNSYPMLRHSSFIVLDRHHHLTVLKLTMDGKPKHAQRLLNLQIIDLLVSL